MSATMTVAARPPITDDHETYSDEIQEDFSLRDSPMMKFLERIKP